MTDVGADRLVGRSGQRARLVARLEEARAGRSSLVLVTGEAGIGKTTLVAHALHDALPPPVTVWAACWADASAPGLWPWTQALNALAARVGPERARAAAGHDAEALAGVITGLGDQGPMADVPGARLLVFDVLARWLSELARDETVVVVMEDLHWADQSSLELLDHLTRSIHTARLLVVGTCRDDEVPSPVRGLMASLTIRSLHLRLGGLDRADVHALLRHLTSDAVADRFATSVHRRTGGRPFFVRELAAVLEAETDQLPASIRDVVAVRLSSLSGAVRRTLCVAALTGGDLRPEVLADILARPVRQVLADLEEAAAVGAVVPSGRAEWAFTHDLVREALQTEIQPTDRPKLHARAAAGLERARAHGVPVAAAEVARHYCEAVSVSGVEPALRWAAEAASADAARLALAEAAAHYERFRKAVERSGTSLPAAALVQALVGEADARARVGERDRAEQLLDRAASVAREPRDAALLAAVAFGVQALGARFAMPRDRVIGLLDEALEQASGKGDAGLEARLAAAVARELSHSIPAHRARAPRLSEHAVSLAQGLDDPVTELACLLARHDVLWTPGTGVARLSIARRLVELTTRVGDEEERAEALLLLANAQLEIGDPGFRTSLHACLQAYDRLGQPRHRYLASTRRAALALLDRDLRAAEDLVEEAAALGERLGEPDAGNVRMSQRLALVQLRGDPEEQRVFADEAVRWWIGAPVHAHAVAAGFLARAGDVEGARREIASVSDLGGWQADRSYLWSVYVGQLAEAAALVGDAALGERILEDLRPLAGACGVNGAVVAFAGSLALTAGRAAAAAGHLDEARALLAQSASVHARLGAPVWERLSRDALAAAPAARSGPAVATLRREPTGGWSICHGEATVSRADTKGWRDLAVLLGRPGQDVHVLELAGSGLRQGPAGELSDARAIAAYRDRLRHLTDDLDAAESDHDTARGEQLRLEHDALLEQLAAVTGRGGLPRPDAAGTTERARKAVTARIRETIRKLEPDLPELAAHLDRAVVTGHWCRYRPDPLLTWRVQAGGRPPP